VTSSTALFAENIATVAYRPGPYRPPDGDTLDTYVDPYRLAGDPKLLTETAAAPADLLPTDTEVLAGPAPARVPLVTAVSLRTGLPAAFLSPAPKEHGTWQQIEGTEPEGRRTVLLDDAARSGASLPCSARLPRSGARESARPCASWTRTRAPPPCSPPTT
jgi:orotate phosphoribosyltransferase